MNSLIAEGKKVHLRRQIADDADYYLKWQTSGEWREYDAPWEAVPDEIDAEAFKRKFIARVEGQMDAVPTRVTIFQKLSNKPVGWVNKYGKERFPDVIWIGIDICEDDCLGKGIGSEALVLWCNYLFDNMDIHKIGMDTWSMNPRMMRVAEKVGFVYEGRSEN